MSEQCILTIAVPTFNMERWLHKNLATYQDKQLEKRLEVLCLNNASEDASKQIIEEFTAQSPDIFRLIDRSTRGYGSSINEAIAQAKGKYFRIVDADDWVSTTELIQLVDQLETGTADIVLTDYQIVNMQTGETTAVRAGDRGIVYEKQFDTFESPMQTLPSIHNTTYRTSLLRDHHFYMQDNMFFVDEEYVVLPYLHAKSVIYYPFDVYRYQVANPEQSTSPKNRAKYYEHREKILRRLIEEYEEEYKRDAKQLALPYCFDRIRRGIGDHFTTLYMYIEDRNEGRKLARQWKKYIQNHPVFWKQVRTKARALSLLNRMHITLPQYIRLKQLCLRQK